MTSTDSSVVEEEGVYLRFLNPDYIPVTRFLPMHKLEKPDAPHTKKAIVCALKNAGIAWKNSLVNFTADGASVYFGCRVGVCLLQKDLNHLVGIHCVGHRLELALKDAAKQISYINTLEELMQSLNKFYHYSVNMWNDLQEAGRALNVNILRPPNIGGTRWIEHKNNGIAALHRNWPALVVHLIQVIISSNTDNASKAKGFLRKLTNDKCVVHLFYAIITATTCLPQ